jgi:TetR/AcrR family transcriptional regulator
MGRQGKRIRDPQRTRARILRASEKLFSERGFAGASMRDIARASKVSQALLHHHFNNKRDLYAAVREHAIEESKTNQESVFQGDRGSAERLIEAIRARFIFDRDNPALRRLGTWARLEGDASLWKGEAELLREICQHVREAQDGGEVRKDVVPFFLAAMVIGLIRHWYDSRELYAKALAEASDLTVPEAHEGDLDEAYLEQVIEVLKRGVAGPRARV